LKEQLRWANKDMKKINYGKTLSSCSKRSRVGCQLGGEKAATIHYAHFQGGEKVELDGNINISTCRHVAWGVLCPCVETPHAFPRGKVVGMTTRGWGDHCC